MKRKYKIFNEILFRLTIKRCI